MSIRPTRFHAKYYCSLFFNVHREKKGARNREILKIGKRKKWKNPQNSKSIEFRLLLCVLKGKKWGSFHHILSSKCVHFTTTRMKCKCLHFRAEIHFYHEDHHENWRSFVRRLERRHSNVLYHNRILLYSSQKRHKRCVNGSTIPDKRCSPLAENDFRRHSNSVVALLFVRRKYVTESLLLKEIRETHNHQILW